jgi:UPF0755 protein
VTVRPRRPPSARAARRRPPRHRRPWLWLAVLAVPVVVLVVAKLSGAFSGDEKPARTTAAGPPPVRVTFPEGLRREEIARLLARGTRLSAGAYLAATGPAARGARLAGRDRPTSLEGFLFPATFLVGSKTTVADIVDEQVSAYEGNAAMVGYGYARSRNLTPYDVLIIASMVEREVRDPRERPVVAGIIYNRLRRGMRLQIDATVLYALGSWTAQLTPSALDVDSPYNTRRHAGLPPGPISNPGLASLKAAAHPSRTRYLYYVARNDGTGRHYFSDTLAQFERDIARARTNAGR